MEETTILPNNSTSPNSPQHPVVSTSSSTTPEPPKGRHAKTNRTSMVILVIVSLVVGLLFGYSLFLAYPAIKNNTQTADDITPKANEITLPKDAVQIQSCADNKGTLYARPSDIPVGPVYMVNNGKVIGLEYMLDQNAFTQGQTFKFLSGLDINVNHVNIGFESQGHEGYPTPHYHVDLYTVGKETETAIKCPNGSSQQMQMPGMSASSSSMPMPSSTSAMPIQSQQSFIMNSKSGNMVMH